ncbi:MAG: hypothetical protein Q8O72_07130 [Bacteroidales bacterium]|nr:hypothetical protein [Bacteroidales bacterium]
MKIKHLFIFLLWAFPFLGLVAQTEQNTLLISQIHVEVNGMVMSADTTKLVKIPIDTPTQILIIKQNNLAYYTEFTYKHKGKRVKLVRRDYVVLPDGKIKYSRKMKEMQELKVSVPGFFTGKSSSSILYDKRQMGSVFVSFKFKYKYN